MSCFSLLAFLFFIRRLTNNPHFFISSAKRFYDSSRPITTIQCLYEGMNVKAWQGPYLGAGEIDGSDWKPVRLLSSALLSAYMRRGKRCSSPPFLCARTTMQYQDASFVTPPFAEFVSGHSTFSAASAFVIRSFLGTDEYG
jgi:hypothetical protein